MAMNIHKIEVSKLDSGTRLNKWIQKYFTNLPFTSVAKLARTGQIRVNGKRTGVNARLEGGDEVRIPAVESTIKRREYKKRKFTKEERETADDLVKGLVYKDEHILVLNKPAGLAVQGGSKIDVSVDSISDLLKLDAEEKPRLVHRLDKDTSGLLLLARSKSAAQELSLALREKTVQKRYVAILDGVPPLAEDVIKTRLKKTSLREERFEKINEDRVGKIALTRYKVLDYNRKAGLSLVQFLPMTGRTHQIRAHSAAIGCPVLGDYKYSNYKPDIDIPLYLHAWQIQIPLFEKNLKVRADLPEYFLSKLKSLKMIPH